MLRWTSEEYREYLRTGKEPARNNRQAGNASPTCCQPSRPSGVTLAGVSQEEIERRWEEAEKRGDVMVLEIPTDPPKRRNKYGNQKIEVDGLKFDSKHEAAVYQELMARVRAGELKCVWRQVKFDLGGGQNASRDSRYAYYADFVTVDMDNRVEVLDAKSEATRKNRTYINKKKQVIAEWGLEIREV